LAIAPRPDLETERALIEQCRRQDFEAFGKVVDAYQNRVYGFVRRMCPNLEEALDITQEVFIRAYQAFARFDGRSSLRTWLFKIAYHLCVDRARREDRAVAEAPLEADAESADSWQVADRRWNPETIVLDDELRAVVERAIEELSDKLRSVLLLHDREDMAYGEIAAALELPVGTVKSRLFLARAQIQDRVMRYWNGEGT
jgi:RNA polymerase sigma-70 factor (ECF subfamily)